MIPEDKWKPGSQSGIDDNFLNIPGERHRLSQSSLQIHITDFIAKLIAQIAKSPMILILPSFPLHQQVP
jgi:hypothetical protein